MIFRNLITQPSLTPLDVKREPRLGKPAQAVMPEAAKQRRWITTVRLKPDTTGTRQQERDASVNTSLVGHGL